VFKDFYEQVEYYYHAIKLIKHTSLRNMRSKMSSVGGIYDYLFPQIKNKEHLPDTDSGFPP
jgi:hypothetical protein